MYVLKLISYWHITRVHAVLCDTTVFFDLSVVFTFNSIIINYASELGATGDHQVKFVWRKLHSYEKQGGSSTHSTPYTTI